MVRYLTRRLGQAALVVAGVVVLTFIVTRLVPGDPAVAYAGPKATAEQLARVRAQFGLDDPLPVQLWNYARDLVTGDWGVSLHTKRPAGLDLVLTGPKQQFALGRVAGLAAERELITDQPDRDQLKLRFQSLEDLTSGDLAEFLKEHLAALDSGGKAR